MLLKGSKKDPLEKGVQLENASSPDNNIFLKIDDKISAGISRILAGLKDHHELIKLLLAHLEPLEGKYQEEENNHEIKDETEDKVNEEDCKVSFFDNKYRFIIIHIYRKGGEYNIYYIYGKKWDKSIIIIMYFESL